MQKRVGQISPKVAKITTVTPLTDVIYTRVSHINQNFFQVWDYACFEMVINDNEHMSNHPAIFWPVSAITELMADIQNPLKTKN